MGCRHPLRSLASLPRLTSVGQLGCQFKSACHNRNALLQSGDHVRVCHVSNCRFRESEREPIGTTKIPRHFLQGNGSRRPVLALLRARDGSAFPRFEAGMAHFLKHL